MKATVTLTLQVNETEAYKVNLSLPTETPTPAKPFIFCVTQTVQEVDKDNVLEVAIADSDHYFVGVAPPGTLLTEAGIEKVVKELSVVVANGTYNPATKSFT